MECPRQHKSCMQKQSSGFLSRAKCWFAWRACEVRGRPAFQRMNSVRPGDSNSYNFTEPISVNLTHGYRSDRSCMKQAGPNTNDYKTGSMCANNSTLFIYFSLLNYCRPVFAEMLMAEHFLCKCCYSCSIHSYQVVIMHKTKLEVLSLFKVFLSYFYNRSPYKHCYFRQICLPVKMFLFHARL